MVSLLRSDQGVAAVTRSGLVLWNGTVAVLLSGSAVGCGSSDGPATVEATLEFGGEGCAYAGPTELSAGDEIRITATNASTGTVDIGFAVARLEDGTTLADVRERGEGTWAPDGPDHTWFSELMDEGAERLLTATLEAEGTWLVTCFVMANQDAGGGDYPATLVEVS